MHSQFKMIFASQNEDGSLEPVEDESTRRLCQEINRAFAEHGHEVSFKPNGVLEVDGLEDPDDVQRIINEVMERNGCVSVDCDDFQDTDFFRDNTDFGFGGTPDFGFGGTPDFGLN